LRHVARAELEEELTALHSTESLAARVIHLVGAVDKEPLWAP
jgi:hypothetical protein